MIYALDTDVLVCASMAGAPHHHRVTEFLKTLVARGIRTGIAAQVVSELVHVVTDVRRFERPLGMPDAIGLARRWVTAREAIVLKSNEHAVLRTLELLEVWRLGRKRALDTSLVAIMEENGVSHLVTLNGRDFHVLGLTVVSPLTPLPEVG